jgi:lycopene cyclase domain-containing protein
MDRWMYAVCLLMALSGLAVLDLRYKLVFGSNARRAALLIAGSVLFFIVWDLCGIGLHIFRVGSGQYMSGVRIAPQLPVEEPVFLLLLMYQALVLWELVRRWHAR